MSIRDVFCNVSKNEQVLYDRHTVTVSQLYLKMNWLSIMIMILWFSAWTWRLGES